MFVYVKPYQQGWWSGSSNAQNQLFSCYQEGVVASTGPRFPPHPWGSEPRPMQGKLRLPSCRIKEILVIGLHRDNLHLKVLPLKFLTEEEYTISKGPTWLPFRDTRSTFRPCFNWWKKQNMLRVGIKPRWAQTISKALTKPHLLGCN